MVVAALNFIAHPHLEESSLEHIHAHATLEVDRKSERSLSSPLVTVENNILDPGIVMKLAAEVV